MWANDPEMAQKWEGEEKKENVEEAIGGAVGLNPNVNVPGMGDVSSPGDPGTQGQLHILYGGLCEKYISPSQNLNCNFLIGLG